MKKIFGGIDLNWKKVIIFAIIAGVYTTLMAIIPQVHYSSLNTITATLEVWIFFGIFIIMNAKSNMDSALKCFVFFLISQPLIYLLQVPFSWQGWDLFKYYRYWFILTILCLPMGYIGYYIKKDKWWGYLILFPMILLTASSYYTYLTYFTFYYPKYILISIFCVVAMIIYPNMLFSNKIVKIAGNVISSVLIIGLTILVLLNPYKYSTELLSSIDNQDITNEYKVYLKDSKYGDVSIKYFDSIECYMVHADFKKNGKTELIVETPDGKIIKYNLTIEMDTYTIEKQKTSDVLEKDKEINSQWKVENVKISVEKDTLTKTSALIDIEDKNENPVSWGMSFAIQKLGDNNIWVDMIAKEQVAWIDIDIEPNENGITQMKLDWSNLYGELNTGTYRIIKYNGFSTLYSEPFTIN